MPDTVVSDRANVSPKVIEQHDDRRTEHENWINGETIWTTCS